MVMPMTVILHKFTSVWWLSIACVGRRALSWDAHREQRKWSENRAICGACHEPGRSAAVTEGVIGQNTLKGWTAPWLSSRQGMSMPWLDAAGPKPHDPFCTGSLEAGQEALRVEPQQHMVGASETPLTETAGGASQLGMLT